MKKIFFILLSGIFLLGLSFNSVLAVAQINENETVDNEAGKIEDLQTENIDNVYQDDNLDNAFDYSLYVEKINNFNIDIKIEKDSSIKVTETIVYNFGSLQKHGIFRDIPYKYKARGGNFKLRFSEINVVDENGQNYTFITSKQGDNIDIKIGDADKYVTGVHTYVISYKIQRALNYFKDHDELYWNATGNEWPVSIGISQVKIELPEGVSEDKLQLKCYTGVYGSTAENCIASVTDNKTVFYEAQNELSYYEGLTIVFGWPKGVIFEPSLQQKIIWTVEDNWYLGLPFVVFIFSFLYWRSRGKDPKKNKTIIAEYEAPDKLTPAEIGTIYDNSADNKDVTATLINLAIRGYLKIKQTGAGSKDYQFIKLKEPSDLENNFEKSVMEAIFGSGEEKNLDDLKNKFYKDLISITNLIYDGVARKGYYVKNPSSAKFGLLFVLAMIALVGSFILGGKVANFYLGASIFISGIIMFTFSMLMAKKTIKGTKALEKILGFKEFLKVTEEERLKFHNPPKMIPEVFEKFLPYAMVLGVENKWAENFKNIYNQEPSWYEGYSNHTFSAILLANSLSNFSSSSQSVFTSQPRSSASGGGSGFSGGGSGGGFGGGGGGSW